MEMEFISRVSKVTVRHLNIFDHELVDKNYAGWVRYKCDLSHSSLLFLVTGRKLDRK